MCYKRHQVAEGVNRRLARTLVREEEGGTGRPWLGHSDSVQGQKFCDQNGRNQRKTEIWLRPESRKVP